MKFLLEKLFLLILCILSLIDSEITSRIIAGGLLSVIVACLCQAAENVKKGRLVFELFFGAVALLFPEPSVFAALPLYEAARSKDIFGTSAIALSVIRGLLFYNTDYLLPLTACLLAVYLAINAAAFAEQRVKLLVSRDDSVELERLLRRRNRELLEKMEYELKINTLNERNRIAREIHDNVGHILTRSLLRVGALTAVCSKDNEPLKENLDVLKDDLNTAMESIRKSVHGIRDESLDLRLELEKITSELRTRFKTEIIYDLNEDLPVKIKSAFTAILKEAVSNILKHSKGDKVQITVREHPALYQLIVFDNGVSRERGSFSGEGMGIDDMRQRAEDIGGNFRISGKDGFTVFVSVKKESKLK